MSKKEQTTLEEAAEKQINEALFKWSFDDEDGIEQYVHDAFIAGAEWQKEQDQPITGNSLEQEWLRYVDKKKKESGGELPSLGEYGWLQIARHFAEWQKKQSDKEVSEQIAAAYQLGLASKEKQMLKNISWYSVNESLPPMDEEVIVLTNEMNGHELPDANHLCFAHRPNPEVAVCYDGWNIPGVKYWMYCPELPEE